MAVKVGSARSDENGKITGGKAGNQNGRELGTQSWYSHSKGWYVLRAKDPEVREKIAKCMEMACKNKHIGYDQNQRNSLYVEAEKIGFNVSKVTKDVETDCSALVRVCCAYAGISVKDFNTSSEAKTLVNTGEFDKLTDDAYCKRSDYLLRGDILVTKTKGHTVVVLSNGSKANDISMTILKKGSKGNAVMELQRALIALNYDLEPHGADGDFGTVTRDALKAFQIDHGLKPDGEYGPLTADAMMKALNDLVLSKVRITGGSVNVRTAPNSKGKLLGIAHKDDVFEYQGLDENNWHLIVYMGQNAWVSGRYSEIV